MHHFFITHKKTFFAMFFVILFSTTISFADRANPYTAGETLDPDCAPNSGVNCTVHIAGGGGGANGWDSMLAQNQVQTQDRNVNIGNSMFTITNNTYTNGLFNINDTGIVAIGDSNNIGHNGVALYVADIDKEMWATYQGDLYGLDFDYRNKKYSFGDFGNNNSTSFNIDDNGGRIYTTGLINGVSDYGNGLDLDFAAGQYTIGDENNYLHNTKIVVNDSNQTQTFNANNGYDFTTYNNFNIRTNGGSYTNGLFNVDFSNKQVRLGDWNGDNDNTFIKIDDASQTQTFNANNGFTFTSSGYPSLGLLGTSGNEGRAWLGDDNYNGNGTEISIDDKMQMAFIGNKNYPNGLLSLDFNEGLAVLGNGDLDNLNNYIKVDAPNHIQYFNATNGFQFTGGSTLSTDGSVYANVQENDTVFNGGALLWQNKANFVGSAGLWAIRTATDGSINFDTNNNFSPRTGFKIEQTGRVDFIMPNADDVYIYGYGGEAGLFSDNGNQSIATFQSGDHYRYGNGAIDIRNTGKVGIGTTNPNHTLDVNGDMGITGNGTFLGGGISTSQGIFSGQVFNSLTLNSGNTTGGASLSFNTAGGGGSGSIGYYDISSPNSTGLGLISYSSSLPLFFRYAPGGVTSYDWVTFNPTNHSSDFTGSVGIGMTNPAYTLDVYKSSTGIVAQFKNTSASTCTINPTTPAFSCSSDINLKKNIITLKDNSVFTLNIITTAPTATTLDKLMTLTPVSYNWKTENDTDSKHTGFIAQQVEQVFPDLVTTDPDTSLKSLNYMGFAPYLVQAVQEMNFKMVSVIPDNLDSTALGKIKTFLQGIAQEGRAVVDLVVANKVQTQQLCIGDSTDSVCVTKDQLRNLLQQNTAPVVAPVNTPDPTPAPVAAPVVPESSIPVVTPNPVPAPEITPVVAPAPIPTTTTQNATQ